MTNHMISPDNQQRVYEVRREAERKAAFVTAAVGGFRRAVEDLAADRAGELVVPPRRRRVDLSTPAGRVRYGYLGSEARNALAELLEALDEVDSRELPIGLLSSLEAARQTLRLSATVDDAELPDCPTCSGMGPLLEDLGEALRGQTAAIESVRGQL